MRALDRKLLRDLGRLRGQVVTIALVIACGIAQLIAFVAFYRSLEVSRDSLYAETRFGDLFVHLDRAPRSLVARLEEISGVAQVQARVVGDFRVLMEGTTDPVLGRFVGLEGVAGTRLNEVVVKKGRNIELGGSREVVVSELFADAHGLRPGDLLTAVLSGREVALRIVGVGLSPEYVAPLNPRTGFPDSQHFGVIWMDGKALAEAMGLAGAFNDAVITLSAEAQSSDVAAAVDRLLEPYGGTSSVLREHQPSNFLINMKIAQWKGMAKFIPLVFLAVAAFILNLVLSRIVRSQREQIATLKALGYSTFALSRHYLSLAMVVGALGSVLGVALGAFEADAGMRLLGRYFNFPVLIYRISPVTVIIGIAVGLASGVLGAFSSVWRTVRLPAAEAMQPEPPERFRRTFVESLGLDRLIGPSGRMVLRDIERHPLRLVFSALSVAFATGLLLIGATFMDSMNRSLWIQFNLVQGEDFTLSFERPHSAEAIRELSRVPGVVNAETQRAVPARLRAGARERDVVIFGIPADPTLRRLRDVNGRRLEIPPAGVALSRPLGDILGVQVGDEVEAQVLEAGRRQLRLPVAAFFDDFSGLNGYMALDRLEAALKEPPSASGALISIDPGSSADITRRLEKLPVVASFSRPELDRKQFEEQESDEMRNTYILLMIVASIVAVAMVFNNARIALAMRSRDLATLRILGFTRGEVAVVLFGEQAIQLVLGVLGGIPLGYYLAVLSLRALPVELFRIPATLTAASAVGGAIVVLIAGSGSALFVRREADRLDLVSVLKARD